MSSSLFFPLAVHPTPLGAFFWLFPVLAALGSVAGPDQARQTHPGMSGSARHAVFAIGGILPLLALVALALVPLASNTLAFFELWPLAFCAVVALLIGRASGSEASLPIALLALGAALPATALLVLSGSCHTEDLRALGACAGALSGPIPSLAFLLVLGGALSTWLGVAGALGQKAYANAVVDGSGTGARMADALSGMAFYPVLLIAIQLLGPGPIWWGAALILLGGALTLGGATRGLGEESLSGLLATTGLAHHGMALLPLGAALVLRSEGEIAAASRAEGASLLLLLCCALARCGLGITSTAVEKAEGRIGDRGGLWRRMPRSGTTLLVCALGAGFAPPLGGFAAGWLALHALLAAAGHAAPAGYGGLALLGAGALPLGGALLLIAWIRGFGATFLGPPPLAPTAPQAIGAIRVPRLAGAVGLLMAACVLLAGLIPGALLVLVRRALQDRGPGDWLRLRAQPIPGHPVPLLDGEASLVPLALLIAIPCLLLATVALVRLAGNRQRTAVRERTYPAPSTPEARGSSLSIFAAMLGWRDSGAGSRSVGTLAHATPLAGRGRVVVTRLGSAARYVAQAGNEARVPAVAWLLTIVALLAVAR